MVNPVSPQQCVTEHPLSVTFCFLHLCFGSLVEESPRGFGYLFAMMLFFITSILRWVVLIAVRSLYKSKIGQAVKLTSVWLSSDLFCLG